jgi:type II secretory pathway pseudopilin PulG
MVKKGDTLVEVTLAIGIFSMIAIAVASVMSGGSASAQLALETTLAREEIDTQADAIRFIHATYSANKDSKDHPYVKLWREITKKAINIADYDSPDDLAAVLQYAPLSCSELYNADSDVLKSAFVINPREFNKLSSDIGTTTFSKNLVLFRYSDHESDNSFIPASTYPRLVFGNKASGQSDDNAILADSSFPVNLLRVEGIYVVPVVDPESTKIVDVIDKNEITSKAAYFDFYIRTCWYGSRTDDPSTISTVIRLHDPDAVFAGGFFDVKYSGFEAGGTNDKIRDRNNIRKEDLPEPTKKGWTFTGWCDGTVTTDPQTGKSSCTGNVYNGTLINLEKTHKVFDLKAMFDHTQYKIRYDLSDGDSDTIRQWNENNPTTTICYHDMPGTCYVQKVNLASFPPDPRRMGLIFSGWCLNGNVDEQGRCIGGEVIPAGSLINN